jgi:DNA end-binding protein Ku
MARRSIWNGAISFGMVVIPVKLYPATDSKDIHFVNLHSTCNTRIRQPRFCPHHDKAVESSEIVRAYEYAKDQYIIMEDSDFDDLPVPSKRTIEITKFIDLTSIDPIYFEKSYSLEPQEVAVKPFYLLKRALESTQRVAVAKIALRQKEYLCCLRPFEQGIMLETMHYPEEIKGMDELDLPESDALVTDQEMDMALALIDQLTGSFEPENYHDEYRSALQQVIEAKLGTGQPATAAAVAPQGKVGDLMEALRASIEATKTERTSRKKATKEPAAKKTPAVKKEPVANKASTKKSKAKVAS